MKFSPSLPSRRNKLSRGGSVSASLPINIPRLKHGSEKFAKKLLGEREIEVVLERLDRLTEAESRMTVAQTLEVVHGLVNNMKVVMDGAQCLLNGLPVFY